MKNATVINIRKLENKELKIARAGKTALEYCWTRASSSIKYCIDNYKLDHCTYVGADVLFFNDPAILIEEMGTKSVLITGQRHLPEDWKSGNETYPVQFMTFKNTADGREVLNWWIDECLTEPNLEELQNRFSTVHVLKHLGGGVAPWNVQQYAFTKRGENLTGTEKSRGKNFDLIFYHYHGFQYTLNNSYIVSDPCYQISRNAIKNIYRPYITALSSAERVIGAFNKNPVSYEVTNDIEWVRKGTLRYMLFFLRGYYKNVYTKTALSYGFLD
ncbi:MAG: glycosyl transferase [Sphingobacteriales bacterium]|nr:MAG: glycosyl transferase [Sphingobacteriales bacterium]